jgi:hypothetical protein
LGKRKRGARGASLAHEDDGEADELSPENAPSIEKSRRVAASVSPIREEDDVPDELSFMEDVMSSVQKAVDASELEHETPIPKVPKPRVSSGGAPERTPIARRIGHMTTVSRQEIVHSGKKPRPSPTTPAGSANHQIRQRSLSASKLRNELTTPRTGEEDEESEDELSPPQVDLIRTPSLPKQKTPVAPSSNNEEVDELSPEQSKEKPIAGSHKTRRPRRAVLDEEDEIEASPAVSKPRRVERQTTELEETPGVEEIDELSPEPVRRSRKRTIPTPHPAEKDVEPIVEELDVSVELEEEYHIEEPKSLPIRAPKPRPQPKKKARRATDDEPPRKLQKRGPTQVIQVMRLKGFGVKGLTVVDTTRTVMEEWVSHRINKLTEKLSSTQDPSRTKELRQNRNVVLAYRENLDDVLLELQDANNTSIDNAAKLRQFKKDNSQLRSDYLALQRDRDQIALENDDITESFMAEKREIEAKNKLSASLYDIEAAIQIGKDRARAEDREDEGPEIPFKMLLDDIARDIGRDDGLLGRVQGFNGMMERAVGFLEGRA